MYQKLVYEINKIRRWLFSQIPKDEIDMIVNGKPYDYSQNFTEEEMITPNYFEFMFNDESEEV